MASPETGTSTSNKFGGEYEVFLSFRGPDTRCTFTNSLHHALLHTGIRVFLDDEELRFGEKISDNLPRAINDSKLYIPIFSKNYASSHWCLDELAKMVDNTSKSKEKFILPIFYNVEPNDVKLKTELYSEAISNLEKQMKGQKNKFSSKDIETWQKALQEVGGFKGWESKKYSGDGALIQAVVHEVVVRLETRQRLVTEDLIGMEDQIAAINSLLDMDSGGVRLIGIYGMGGIGKTTLASIIFNQLYSQFSRNCCFLEGVRETAKTEGLEKLQEKLLSDISYSGLAIRINSIGHGFNRIKETICNKKMLIVLDDVDEGKQIQNLIPVNSLYLGTTILVTTRDKSVMNIRGFENKFKEHEIVGLSDEDALKLFSKHAFNDDSPPANYHTLSKSIVSTANGLPLALEAIGSSLYQKKKEIWEEWLEKLKKTPHEDVLAKLKISYETLKHNQQQIFLDVACFFVGQNKTNPMYMWKDCEFWPEDAIDVLIKRCMIKVLDGDRFWMHDQFRDLGRVIAKEESTRLWDEKDIIRQLRLTSTEIKESVQVQALRWLSSDRGTVTSEQIKRFPHMRFLSLNWVNCQGDFTGCLSELRWINLLYACTGGGGVGNECLNATNLLHLENAVVVNLTGLQFTDDVFKSLIKRAKKLKVLSITRNGFIHGTPTFPKDSPLEKLTIHDNFLFSKIDRSIGNMSLLTDLSVEFCHKLRKLPEQIGELRSLQHLSLKFCFGLIELPDSVSKLVSLTKLDVSRTGIKRLPDSIGRLPSLSFVDVSCTPIEKLPSTTSEFRQLRTLHLGRCDGIQELPMLPRSLTALLLVSTSLLTVPNLSYLTNLVELDLSDRFDTTARSDIIQTCELRWIGKLFKLRKLYFCFPNVHAPTIELGFLSRLKELTLYGLDLPTFKQLPSNLIVLKLYDTRGKQVHLDGLPPSEKVTVSSSSRKSRENKVHEQHDVQLLDILESSKRSHIQDCKSSERLAWLPKELGCNELQAPELIDHWRGAFHFPSSLEKLQKFVLSGFPELLDIQFVSTLESLEEFSVEDCSSFKSLGGMSNLKNLKNLSIIRCMSLQVVEGIEELEYLYELKIEECRSMERIFDASIHITWSASFSQLDQAVHRPHDPSSIPRSSSTIESNDDPRPLKMLKKFILSGCPKVHDIQFVSTFESMEEFSIRECSSLKNLGGLSNLKNLKQLKIDQCPSLQVVEGIDELEFLGRLGIYRCRSIERIFDASSSKIPNMCMIEIEDCEKLPNSIPYPHWDNRESYREKILSGTKQAPDSEIETRDSETEIEDPLQKTNQGNKEKKRARKTESAKEQGKRKRRRLQKRAWVRVFHGNFKIWKTFSKKYSSLKINK